MFGAKTIESIQTDVQPRINLDINGLAIFIAAAGETVPPGPVDSHQGIDHCGLKVDNLQQADELKEKNADFVQEPELIRPAIKIAFIGAPAMFESSWSNTSNG